MESIKTPLMLLNDNIWKIIFSFDSQPLRLRLINRCFCRMYTLYCHSAILRFELVTEAIVKQFEEFPEEDKIKARGIEDILESINSQICRCVDKCKTGTKDFAELKTFKVPPQKVLDVFKVSYLLLGGKIGNNKVFHRVYVEKFEYCVTKNKTPELLIKEITFENFSRAKHIRIEYSAESLMLCFPILVLVNDFNNLIFKYFESKETVPEPVLSLYSTIKERKKVLSARKELYEKYFRKYEQ